MKKILVVTLLMLFLFPTTALASSMMVLIDVTSPFAQVYMASIPTYVSGPWTFTVGSKKHRADTIDDNRAVPAYLKYYNREVHKAAFALPEYIRQMLD